MLLLLSAALAQTGSGPASLQHIATSGAGPDFVVDIVLSGSVKATADVALHPDRILVDIEGANCAGPFSDIAVGQNGILRVRAAQHSTSPPVTRVVVDLDRARPYVLRTEGSHVILTVSPYVEARKGRSQGAPAAATSGSLIGLLRHDKPHSSQSSEPTPDLSSIPLPPPSVAHTGVEPSAASAATANPAPPPAVARGDIAPPIHAAALPSPVPVLPPAIAVNRVPIGATETSAQIVPAPEIAPPAPTPAPEPPPALAAAEPTPAAPQPMAPITARADDPSLHTVFHVKYVADGVAYLDGGSSSGLAEGMKLEIIDSPLPAHQGESIDTADKRVVAELEVSGVAETSAVTDIHSPQRPVKVGDLAYLSSADEAALIQQRALSATRQYPAVVTFTDDDTPDEEARVDIPRPPLPSVNRGRGRIGFEYIGTISHGTSSLTSTNLGGVFRGDITRIGGTFWNLSGYWRGRLTQESVSGQPTLQDLLNRTYHLNLTYDNPQSNIVAGFGRLYLPWAPSLDTLDGGYFGYRPRHGVTFGIFGGSTPDPTSWDYSPNRAIGGAFINFEGGSYDAFHYTSTSGAAMSMVNWASNRPFAFFENGISYKRLWSFYDSLQFDSPKGTPVTPAPGPGLGRDFLTFRVQPARRLEITLNHTYFRDVPTYDPTLLGTGLLDKFLLQGFSGGVRVEVLRNVFVSGTIGQSFRTGDAHSSLNQMFGLEFARLPWWRLRADAHYARFSNSFGSGAYTAFTVSRQVTDSMRVEILAGQQDFTSPLTANNRSRFLTSTFETNFGLHYFLQNNFTTARGQLSYDQWMFTMGYRFDTKGHKQE